MNTNNLTTNISMVRDKLKKLNGPALLTALIFGMLILASEQQYNLPSTAIPILDLIIGFTIGTFVHLRINSFTLKREILKTPPSNSPFYFALYPNEPLDASELWQRIKLENINAMGDISASLLIIVAALNLGLRYISGFIQ